MRALVAAAALLLAPGCEGVRYGCVNACLGASGGYKGQTRLERPDRSTFHCDALPGTLYRSEHGDELAFGAGTVEWRRNGGSTEARKWKCDANRSIRIGGFAEETEGFAFLSSSDEGILVLGKTRYRIVGGATAYVFPCEPLPGRTFWAETGDTLAFASSGKTAVWTHAGLPRPLAWKCSDRDLVFVDGGVETAVPYAPGGPGLPTFLRWNGVRYDGAVDGKRPVFGCERLAGRTYRRRDSGDVLMFGATTAEWRRATGVRTLRWTCFDRKFTFQGAMTSEGTLTPSADRVCYDSHCYEYVPEAPPVAISSTPEVPCSEMSGTTWEIRSLEGLPASADRMTGETDGSAPRRPHLVFGNGTGTWTEVDGEKVFFGYLCDDRGLTLTLSGKPLRMEREPDGFRFAGAPVRRFKAKVPQ